MFQRRIAERVRDISLRELLRSHGFEIKPEGITFRARNGLRQFSALAVSPSLSVALGLPSLPDSAATGNPIPKLAIESPHVALSNASCFSEENDGT